MLHTKCYILHTSYIQPGLILVIFLTEPAGLALHNLREPDRKTLSPAKAVLPNLLTDDYAGKKIVQLKTG